MVEWVMPPAAVALRAAVDGTIEAQVDDRFGRPAMVVRSISDRRAGALGSPDGDTIALAARTARQSGMPIVLVLASSGADVHEGVEALVGWGRAAKELVACSGIIPILAAADRARPYPGRRCCSAWPTSWS